MPAAGMQPEPRTPGGTLVDLSVGRVERPIPSSAWGEAADTETESTMSAGGFYRNGAGSVGSVVDDDALEFPSKADRTGPIQLEPLLPPVTPREKVLALLGLPPSSQGGRPLTDRDFHRAIRTAPDDARRGPRTSRAQTAEPRWRNPNRRARPPSAGGSGAIRCLPPSQARPAGGRGGRTIKAAGPTAATPRVSDPANSPSPPLPPIADVSIEGSTLPRNGDRGVVPKLAVRKRPRKKGNAAQPQNKGTQSPRQKRSGRAKFQKAVRRAEITHRLTTAKTDTGRKGEQLGKKMEMRRLKEVWVSVDADGSGELDRAEVRAVFRAMGKNVSDRDFLIAMNQIDTDRSDEVDFGEFSRWWAREMAKDGIVAPSTFTFRNLCVRAVLRQDVKGAGGQGEHHWIAEDVRNVLYNTTLPGEDEDEGRKVAQQAEQSRMLQDLWTAFDEDKSGKLDLQEVEQVLASALPDMSRKDLEKAFEEMDDDGSGEVDFHEFTQWWQKQGDSVQERIQAKAFENTMDSLKEGEVTHVIIDTAAGPEQVRLVAPKGLFRLVIRSKSASTKAFYEWAEKLVTTTRVERKGRRRAVIGVPTVSQLCKDYTLRNILVTTKNKDSWMFHSQIALDSETVKTYTMASPLPHKPNIMCVKAYIIVSIPARELSNLMWDWGRRGEWDLFLNPQHNPTVLSWVDKDDAVVTHSRFDFPYEYTPSPIPPAELVLAHTRRTDTDGTIILASASAEYEGLLPKKRTMRGSARAEVYCAGFILAPIRKGTATRISFVSCIQSGHGPAVPVACQRQYHNTHAVSQLEKLMDYLERLGVGQDVY